MGFLAGRSACVNGDLQPVPTNANIPFRTVSVVTMAMIWFFVPLKPVEGNFFEKLKDMDWIGSILSLAMTLCILVNMFSYLCAEYRR